MIAHFETLLHDSQFNPDNSSSQTTDGFRGFPSPEQEPPIAQDILKLPEIKLPVFDGDIKHWQHFRDLVSDLIINNPNLRDSTKFFHLHSCLSPKLQQSLANIPQSANNFSVAWETLTKRYDNPRLLVNAHISELFHPPLYQPNSSASVRSLIDHIQANVAALRAMRLSVSIEDLLISQLILNQLDPETLKLWEQHTAVDSVPSLLNLIDFLERRARVLDISPLNQCTDSVNPRFPPNRFNPTNKKCQYCAQRHSVFYCQQFLNLSVSERNKQVKLRNLCRNCLVKLGPNHVCSSRTCQHCCRPHHTLLHPDFSPVNGHQPPTATNFRHNDNNQRAHIAHRRSPNTFQAEAHIASAASPPEPSTSEAQVTSATTVHSGMSNQCLLATAVVTIFDKNNSPVKCRALLDGGSDCNLITKSCVKRLNLSPNPSDVKVTGLCLSSHQVTESVDIALHSNTSSFQTNLIVSW